MADLVLGDDHTVFLDALSAVLGQHGFAVTVARSAAETLACVRRGKPDICLMDRHFAGEDGVDAIGHMIAASPQTKVLVLSADADTDGIMRALRAGASGYLHKTQGVAVLTAAIDRVLRGEVVVSVPKATAARRSTSAADAHRLASHLTDRERECLTMLVEGLDTPAMVAKLGVSRTTVRSHIQALLTKLGVHSRLEAASLAVRYRLLDDDPARVRSRELPAELAASRSARHAAAVMAGPARGTQGHPGRPRTPMARNPPHTAPGAPYAAVKYQG